MTIFKFNKNKGCKVHFVPRIRYTKPVYLNGEKIICGSLQFQHIRSRIDIIFNGKWEVVK